MASGTNPPTVVLNSWKEIAQHVGRGVRTVQRWERELGMPVRRPHAKAHSPVIGIPEEIDQWLRGAPVGELSPGERSPVQRSPLQRSEDHSNLNLHVMLRRRTEQLRGEHEQVLATLMERMQHLMQSSLAYAQVAEIARRSREQLKDGGGFGGKFRTDHPKAL